LLVKIPERVPSMVNWSVPVITGVEVTELQQTPRAVTAAPPSLVTFPPLIPTLLSVGETAELTVVITVGVPGTTTFP
jgi:hypothetical protein